MVALVADAVTWPRLKTRPFVRRLEARNQDTKDKGDAGASENEYHSRIL